jgi:hypothetical protein
MLSFLTWINHARPNPQAIARGLPKPASDRPATFDDKHLEPSIRHVAADERHAITAHDRRHRRGARMPTPQLNIFRGRYFMNAISLFGHKDSDTPAAGPPGWGEVESGVPI